MTQAVLAEQANISVNFLSKLERGHSNQVSSQTLYLLAQSLGTSMENLVDDNVPKITTNFGPNRLQLIKLLNQYSLTEQEKICQSIINLVKPKEP
ncbi:MAG: helix-turn-helix transcriptional regulator [Limosilactobacillus sp.]|jgi:XRE family aerobic/anaerobic benzoate catabolism transcriptional regulator|nr:helix-turn-helix transcriptional regulator [Limosilactobacillus sp.]MCH3928806.1 helix-turn-helix transcriptional regulator [Limosilactobacillus sp.]